MEATRKVGLYESMVKRPTGVVYKLAGIEAKFFAGNEIYPSHHLKFKTFEDREAYIEKFFKDPQIQKTFLLRGPKPDHTEKVLADFIVGA